jgi:hypothetical protein
MCAWDIHKQNKRMYLGRSGIRNIDSKIRFEYEHHDDHLNTNPIPIPIPEETITRNGTRVNPFESQKKIIRLLMNPTGLQKVKIDYNNDNHNDNHDNDHNHEHAECEFSRNFPKFIMFSVPTGLGKTMMTCVSMLRFLSNSQNRMKLRQDFIEHTTKRLICSTGVFKKQLTTLNLYENVLFVYCPKQLVGNWRDTLRANANSDGLDVCVYPKGKTYNLGSFNDHIDEIRTNPNRIFVFVTQQCNITRFLVNSGDSNSLNIAGGLISDEADSVSIGINNEFIAMYNLLITATPQRVINYEGKRGEPVYNYIFLKEIAHSLKLNMSDFVHLLRGEITTTNPTKRLSCLHFIGILRGIHHIPYELIQELQQETSNSTPTMNFFRFKTTHRTILRQLGLVTNDLVRGVDIRGIIDLEIAGNTLRSIVEEIKGKINSQEINHRKKERLTIFLKYFEEKYTKECGICFEEYEDITFSNCCCYAICENCLSKIQKCPQKCTQDLHVSKISMKKQKICDHTSNSMSSSNSTTSNTSSNSTTSNTSSNSTTSMFDINYFHEWIRRESVEQSKTQLSLVHELISQANRCGIQNIILAGSRVSQWSFLDDLEDIEGYRLFGREKKLNTAKNLDYLFTCFDHSIQKNILILDTEHFGGSDVAGTDFTNIHLIIEVGNRNPSQQLMGRGKRLSSINKSFFYVFIE